MSFLNLENKTYLVLGVANKKSVAFHIGKTLAEEGARVLYGVRSEARKKSVAKLLAPAPVYVCDVEQEQEIERLEKEISRDHPVLHGLVHSIAFANYSQGTKPFHETAKADFLQSVDITCFSLIRLARAFKDRFDPDASVVTVSISTTRMAAENYGYMAPAKAALDSSLCFLAKSFSGFSRVRFNSVNAGLLKTSASAGIPGYIDSYLYAEQLTLRKKALTTQEAANAAVFLLSERSSGINARGIVLDAGMSVNYFDQDLVKKAMRPPGEKGPA
ncbi:MAG: enoyl-ACP reductase [Nitrospinaceae bacterium]